MSKKYPKTPVVAIINDNPSASRTIKLGGRVAQTIHALVDKGALGVTALEMSGWAHRLSAYIHILRRAYGIAILTVMEPHEGGRHARYVLQPNITLKEPEAEV